MSTTDLMNATADAITINVGMDEVVSVFVSDYETALYAKKHELSSTIKTIKKDIKQLNADLVESVDRKKYQHSVPELKLTSSVHQVDINWQEEIITVHVLVQFEKQRYGRPYVVPEFEEKISPAHVRLHSELLDVLKAAEEDLGTVLYSIKNVGRKEREIRGKISRIKLEQSGYDSLLQNPDLIKLVQL